MKLLTLNSEQRLEWRQNWLLVLSSMMGVSLLPVLSYTSGVFITPLEEEFGWSRTLISSGLTIQALILAVFAPFIGAAVDKFGPRRIAIPGVFLFCVSFGLLSTTNSSGALWMGLWVLVGTTGLLVTPTIWTLAVASRFDAARGMALAVTLCGTGITTILMPPLATYFTDTYDWRAGFVAVAAVQLLVVGPLVILFFYGRSDLGRRRRATGEEHQELEHAVANDGNVRAQLFSGAFIRLSLSALLFITAGVGVGVHFVPIVTGYGMERVTAAFIAGSIGGFSIFGRLTAGLLLDRVDSAVLGGITFLFPAIACALLLTGSDTILICVIAAACIGFGLGAELDIVAYLTSRHFPLSMFGVLFGVLVGLMNLGIAIGPLITSFLYDQSNSYSVALLGLAATTIVASALMYSVRAAGGSAQGAESTQSSSAA